jgi:hypothetical protein
MEKFDSEAAEDDVDADGGYAGPMRRWSDEASDPE